MVVPALRKFCAYRRKIKVTIPRMVHQMWRDNLQCSRTALTHNAPEVFTRSYWQKTERVTVPWLLFKVLLAIYAVATWYLAFINFGREVHNDKHFIYLTNWSYLLLAVQFLLSALIVLERFSIERRRKGEDVNLDSLPLHYKLYWAIFNVSAPSAIMVTIIFWVAVYNPKRHPLDVINITTHAVNSLVTLLDFMLVGHPYRLIHFHWTFAYVTAYAVFTVLYFFAGGTDVWDNPFIYSILDWRSPGPAIGTCIGVLIFVLLTHTMFWGLYRLKKSCRQRCYASRVAKHQGQENYGLDQKSTVATIVV